MKNNESPQVAVYPGTFDPITNGHIDIIQRALRLFPRLVVAVAKKPSKHLLFSVEERLTMIRSATRHLPKVQVESFEGLLIHYMREKSAIAVIRGIRAVSDFEYEFQMALMNRKLDDHIETVFLMPSEEYTYLSSSLIKEVAAYGGEVKTLVPEIVSQNIFKKLGVTAPLEGPSDATV